MLPDPLPDQWKQQKQQPSESFPDDNPEDYAQPPDTVGWKLSEHGAVVGATGSGKTFFTVAGLLPHFAYQYPEAKRYILDSTDDPAILRNLPPDTTHVFGNEAPDLLRSTGMTQLWTPRNSKIPHDYAKWFRSLNDAREKQIVVIDEIASITREAEEELEVLLKQLRKHGGTVICLTQQIAKVTTTLFSQVTHYFQFAMGDERYDSAQSRRYLRMSKEEQRDPLYQYGFFYRRTRGNNPFEEYSGMDAFLRRH